MNDVEAAIMNGEIIEQYPDDYPYPSCLILGLDEKGRYIHVLCALSGDVVCLITTYEPDTKEKWNNDLKTRRG